MAALEREAPLSLSDAPETNCPCAASRRRCVAFLCEGSKSELPPVLCSCGRRLWTLNPSPTSAFLHWRFSGSCEMLWLGGAQCAA